MPDSKRVTDVKRYLAEAREQLDKSRPDTDDEIERARAERRARRHVRTRPLADRIGSYIDAPTAFYEQYRLGMSLEATGTDGVRLPYRDSE